LNHDEENIELTDAIKQELDKRLERFHKGKGKSYTLEEAKKMWAKKKEK
jgi:putative addiction module component (TIGR02574 family)|tara:strand:- start:136 stop:282 length:147 start_codon:yes stop_codon:yes gene_type:complete